MDLGVLSSTWSASLRFFLWSGSELEPTGGQSYNAKFQLNNGFGDRGSGSIWYRNYLSDL